MWAVSHIAGGNNKARLVTTCHYCHLVQKCDVDDAIINAHCVSSGIQELSSLHRVPVNATGKVGDDQSVSGR